MRALTPGPAQVAPSRYVVKWVNGVWTIFDTQRFCNCEPNLGTRKNAERVLRG